MHFVISPAKTLDYETPSITETFTQPEMLDQSQLLIDVLNEYSVQQVAELMKLSDKLASLNVARYADWQQSFTSDNAKQAVLAFKGDVYTGLDAETMSPEDWEYCQSQLRILSGLYGLLKPLDLMMPYRLEMGTKLANSRGKDLYQFWGERITEALNQLLSQSEQPVLVNLASNEYFKAVKPKQLQGRLITPVFKDWKNGQYKIISFYAKKARGLMTRYAIDKRVSDAEQLKEFNYAGYYFSEQESKGDTWVFLRDEPH